jgi:hypothetical protein
MKTLFARILCSAARTMWQKDPTLGKYTSETNQHELNLAFQYASELRNWFPWLDCDVDVSKVSCNNERPDIVLHRRGTHALNFLVIEVKREKYREAVPLDLKQIRERWFESHYCYRFGAVVIMEDDKPEFEAQVLSRQEKDDRPVILSHTDMREPISIPKFANDRKTTILETVDRLLASEEHGSSVDVSALEKATDKLVYALYA